MATVNKVRTQAKIEIDGSTSESEVYEFFDDVSNIIITLSFPDGTGSATIQTSTSISEDLANDNAVWVDWDSGTITDTTTRAEISAPNALKVVNDGSDRVLVEIRGNYSK